MAFYQQEIDEVSKNLHTNISNGLTKKEALERLKKYGANKIPEKKPTSVFIILLRQFLSPLMFILLIAVILSLFINEPGDAIVISIAVILNVIVGFIQEWKAEKAALKLKSLEEPYCNVKRDGKILHIKSKELVPGDIVLLSAGTKVPADIRLVNVINFQVEEAILTGESKPVKKNTLTINKTVTVGDRINIAFSGTHVLSGKAEGIVTQTGVNSYIGEIAKLVSGTKQQATPLQEQIKRFSWWLGAIFIGVTTIVGVAGLITGIALHKILIISIALAVAAIPEGLLVAVTVVLAIGMQRMLKRHALVRHLVAAETLGSVSIICTDKTGTLTQGHMQVVQIVTQNNNLKDFDKIKSFKEDDRNKEIKNILLATILNNDAQLTQDSTEPIGHPTEIALLKAAENKGFDISKLRNDLKRIDEIPFSSEIKYMATTHKINSEEKIIVKGAPEKIFEMCKPNTLNNFKNVADEMTKNGLRILAVATKDKNIIDLKNDLNNLNFLGLIGIQDPLRPQAKQTINELKNAGIKVILVTGDHKDTAANIAQKSGIIEKTNSTMIGSELDKITDKQLEKEITKINIFARVEPKHKIRIVKAWQAHQKPVAMIGDGVNDAPALKAADIGVALGSGSDVAHEISDIVLLDNNLSTIDAAVKEGRRIFDNIRKVIIYLMADSFSEIILIGGAILFGLPLPMLASQIFWINLVTDGFPYLALTVEPAEPEIMHERPRPKNEPVVNKEMKFLIFIIGIITDIGLFILYAALLKSNFNIQHIRTMIFTAIAIDSLFYVFSVRSMRKSILKMNPLENKWMIPAVISGFFIQLCAVYLPPMQKLFSTVSLNLIEWLIILGLAVIKITAIEITKKILINNKIKKEI